MSKARAAGGIGAKLRDARERRGLSLRQIADVTKISAAVLDALERNDISRVPAGIFGRGFVRSFAAEVGLDPEQAVRDFTTQFPDDSVAAGYPPVAGLDDQPLGSSDRHWAPSLRLALALCIPIAAVALYLGARGRTSAAPDPVEAAASVVVAARQAATVSATPGSTRLSGVQSPAPADDLVRPSRTAGSDVATDILIVDLVAAEKCWISTAVDGERAQRRELQPGERQRLDVRRQLILIAGNAAALTVTLNGEAARSLGGPGQVATMSISPTNFRDYLASR